MSHVLSIGGLVLETISSVMLLSHQGSIAGSATQGVLLALLSALPAAYYVSSQVFERLMRDPVADLAMQEAWQMPRRL